MFNWSICCRKLFKSLKNRAEIKLSGARQQFQIAFEHSFTSKNLQIIFGKFVVNYNSFIIINKIFTQTKLYFLLTKNLEQFPTLIESNLFNWLIKLINIFYILSPFKQRWKAKSIHLIDERKSFSKLISSLSAHSLFSHEIEKNYFCQIQHFTEFYSKLRFVL